MKPRCLSSGLFVLACFALQGCASRGALQPPQLRVDKIGVDKAGISGLGLEVFFSVRNPNEHPLHIERFEYELWLNDQRLGRGDYSRDVRIEPFGSERVMSDFQLSWFNLPGGVKRVLDEDEVRAHVEGRFRVRERGGDKWLQFSSDARVNLRGRGRRDRERDERDERDER